MNITATGHWKGDPREHCGRLTLEAKTTSDARKLARLNRVLSDADMRDRLLELAERIEAETAAQLDPAFS